MTTQPVGWKTLWQLAPVIRDELLKRIRAGTLAVGDVLQQVFVAMFGTNRSWEERTLYLLFAAPLARRIAIDLADASDRVGTTDVRVADLKAWFYWLDTMDPMSARIVDLHYFAGLTFKQTAAAVGMPLQYVVRDLRNTKGWLMVKLA